MSVLAVRNLSRETTGSPSGIAVVEFAIIAPVLLLFLAAIVDFSMYSYQRLSIIQAARNGARSAATVSMDFFDINVSIPNCSDIESTAKKMAEEFYKADFDKTDIDFTASVVTTGMSSGSGGSVFKDCTVQVRASGELTCYICTLFGGADIDYTASFVIEPFNSLCQPNWPEYTRCF